MKLKSKISKKKPIDFDKLILIEELRADQNIVNQQRAKLSELYKNVDPKVIEQQLINLVVRDNMLNTIIQYLSEQYTIKVEQQDLDSYFKKFKTALPNLSDEILEEISRKAIIRRLIYDDLSTQWALETSDNEAKTAIQNYYQQTNQPVRELLDDKQKFADIKTILTDEKISNELLKRFWNKKVDIKKKKEEPKK